VSCWTNYRISIVFKQKWALYVVAGTGAVAGICIGISTVAGIGTDAVAGTGKGIGIGIGIGPGISKVIIWTCAGGINHMKTTSIESKDQW